MEFLSHKNDYVKLYFLKEREKYIIQTHEWIARVEP